MKKWNNTLNIIIGSFVGVFIGRVIYTLWDFKTHPELYAIQSAPWYTSILVNGVFTLVVLLVCVVIKAIIKHKAKKVENQITRYPMKIEHIAMYVNNLEATRDFFIKYFGAQSNNGYHNSNTGFRSFFLTFEDGARLEIMRKPQMEDPNKTITRTGYIHIAFSVGSKEKVDELTDQLRKDGYEVISEPRTTGDGYYESCIIGIEGNQVEIMI